MKKSPYTIFLSSDSHLLKVKTDSLLCAFPPSETSFWKKKIFWGDEGLSDNFWSDLQIQDLFGENKALILRNAQLIPADSLKELSKALLRVNSSIWPLICFEVSFEKGQAKLPAHVQKLECYQKAVQQNWCEKVEELQSNSLPVFIRSEAQRLNIKMNEEQVALLSTLLPHNASAASLEMEKLALLCDAHSQLPKNFTNILINSEELNLFELIKMLEGGKAKQKLIWERINLEKDSDANIFALIALITREARILWQCLHGEQVSLAPFLLSSKKVLAQRLGLVKLSKLWEHSLQAELQIKSGAASPQQALDLFIHELINLFDATASSY